MRPGGSKTCPAWGFCFCAAPPQLLAPSLALFLAPEPSNLAGKDKHKPYVPTPMDLTAWQRFPGQKLHFRIWEEKWGDGMCARESCSEMYFSVESLLTGLTSGLPRCTSAVGPGVKPVTKPGC